MVSKEQLIGKATQVSPVRDTQGLSQHEIVALVSVAQNRLESSAGVSGWGIKQDMNKAGFTDIAVSVALAGLKKKGMVMSEVVENVDGEERGFYLPTDEGESWLLDNQDKLILTETERGSQTNTPPF